MDTVSDLSWCPVCSQNGRRSELQTFHINFEESMVMCPEPSCTYPIGVEPLSKILNGEVDTPPVIVSRHQGSTMPGSLNVSSCLSSLSTVTSISSPIPSVPSLVSAQISQDLTLNTRCQDVTAVLEQNLNLNDSIPNLDTDFLDELFDTAANVGDVCDMSVVPHQTVSTSEQVELPTADLDPQTEFGKAKSDAEVIRTVSAVSKSLESSVVVSKYTSLISSPALSTLAASSSLRGSPVASTNVVNTSIVKEINVLSPVLSQTVYPQWKNKDSFCWLDVAMNLIIHCDYILKLAASLSSDNVLSTLLNVYKQSLELANDKKGKGIHLETSLGHVVVKTGGGQSPRKSHSLSALAEDHPLVVSPVDEISKEDAVDMLLNDVRESLWKYLQPKMRIQRGTHDSPVFALPLLLHHKEVRDKFMVSYTWQMVCCHCGHHHEDKVEKIMPTFPNVPSDFSMLAPCFIRSCFKCDAKKQRINMVFDRLPPVVFVHFVEGISATSLDELDFQYRGSNYRVTGVVQYKLDHFVCWLRHQTEELWRKCDDLEGFNTVFSTEIPEFPTKEIHVVMWEVIGECVHLKDSKKSVGRGCMVSQSVDGFEDQDGVKSTRTASRRMSPQSKIVDVLSRPLQSSSKQMAAQVSGTPSQNTHKVAAPASSSVNVKQKSSSGIQLPTRGSPRLILEKLATPVSTAVVRNLQQRTPPVKRSTADASLSRASLSPVADAASPVPGVLTQPLASETSFAIPLKPTRNLKRKAGEERMRQIRERLEQLRAANARKTSGKAGLIPPASPVAQQTYSAYVANSASPTPTKMVTPATIPSPVSANKQRKSYLAALQPFLQRTVEKLPTSSSGTKQFLGYMTKAERAEAEKATSERRKQEDAKITALLAANNASNSRRSIHRKSITKVASPKKSVRFTGDSVNDPNLPRMKRSLVDPQSSPSKHIKQEHQPVRNVGSLPEFKDCSANSKSFRDKISNMKIKPVQPHKLNTQTNSAVGTNMSTAEANTANGSDRPSSNPRLQTPTPGEDQSNIAKEISVMDELLGLVFDKAEPNSATTTSEKDALNNRSLTPDICENSMDSLETFDDTSMFSMPMFF